MYEQIVFPNNPHQLVAPYWGDVDTRDSGNVWYMQSTDSELLAKARRYIRRGFVTEQEFQPTNLFIATWDHVGYYNRKTDKVCIFILAIILCPDLCGQCILYYISHQASPR